MAYPMADTGTVPFWYRKSLTQMTRTEWESLCDGCGRCCLNKLIDDENQVHTTAVACRLLDLDSCQCGDYKNRKTLVPDCIRFTSENLEEFSWLPDSCAYRLLLNGFDLPEWHPLVTGDRNSVHEAGFSVRDMAVSETEVPDPEDWHDYLIQIVEE